MTMTISEDDAGIVSVLPTMTFDQIDAPGAYLLHEEGYLMRVPSLVLSEGPAVSITGAGPLRVTRISEDPWIPIGRARTIAANHDLQAHF